MTAPITRVALDHALDHVVVELAIAGHQRAAVRVAGQDRSLEEIERLVEALVGQVGDVQDHPELVHHLAAAPCPLSVSGPALAGAEGVRARSVVGETDHPQPVVPPEPGLLRVDDRVGAFHQQDVADRRAGRVRLPLRFQASRSAAVRIIRMIPCRSNSW